MNTLGSTFAPPGFQSGGLRYHGMAPMVSHALKLGLREATSYNQLETFAVGVHVVKAEGVIPAPEANHAVVGAIREALRCKESGEKKPSFSISAALVTSTCRPILIATPGN